MSEKKSFSQKIMNLQWLWGPVGIAVSVLIGFCMVIYIFWGVITTPGTAFGSDVTSFAHTAKYLVDNFRQTGHFMSVDLGWYAGFELFHAPPLISIFLGIIYYFSHDINITTRIFHPLGISFLFLGIFWLMKKEKYSTLNAVAAGLIYILMPSILMSLQSYTKLVALFFWPFGFYFANQILTTTKTRNIAYFAIFISLMVFSHPMMGAAFAVMAVTYSFIRAILDREIITRRFFFVILGVVLGFLLSAGYLVPFFFESAGRLTVSPAEGFFIGGWKELFTGFGGYVTFLLPVASLYVVWRRKRPKLTALYLTSLLMLSVLCGYYFIGLQRFFPFNEIYYYVWFFCYIFTSTYLVSLIFEGNGAKNLFGYSIRLVSAAVLVSTIFYLTTHPISYLAYFKKNEDPGGYTATIELAQAIESTANDGRIMVSRYPFGFLSWFLSLNTSKPNIEGHYFGIAKINGTIAHINDAIHYQYPDYIFNQLRHLNTRYFVVNSVLPILQVSNGAMVGEKFLEAIPLHGFRQIFSTSGIVNNDGVADVENRVYLLDKPSSYLVPIDEKVLIIGNYSSTLASAISGKIPAVEGSSPYLDDYDQDFLSHFDTVVLYGFSYHDKAKAESTAREYVKNNGHLVLDMINMGISPLADDPSFLGVTGLNMKITHPVSLEGLGSGEDPAALLLPKTFILPDEIFDEGKMILARKTMKDWNSLEYFGLDQSLVKSPLEDSFSILGYKNVDGGKVTFIGMNFFYHAFLTHDETELKFIENLIGESQTAQDDQGFVSQNEVIKADKMSFDVQNDQNRLVFLSLAASRHWKIFIDGKKVNYVEMESLMVIDIPPGTHHIEARYSSTPIMALAWIVTFLTLTLLAGIIISSKRGDK